MGFLDFAADLVSATVKTALTPIAIVKDVVNVATGQEADATKELLKSAAKDVERSGDDLCD
jgi:hypothetical protein